MRFSSLFLLSVTLLATGAFSSPMIIKDGPPPSRPGTPDGPPAYSTKKDVGVQTDAHAPQPPRLRDAVKAKAQAVGKFLHIGKKKRDFDDDLYEYVLRRSPMIIDQKDTPPSRPGTPVGPPAYSTKKDVGVQTDAQAPQPPRLRDAVKAKASAVGRFLHIGKKKRSFDDLYERSLDDLFERMLDELDDLYERSPIIIDEKGTPPSRPGTPVGPPAYSTKKDVGVQTDAQAPQPPRLRDAVKAKAQAVGKFLHIGKKKRDFEDDLYEYLLRRSLGFEFDVDEYLD